jgi:Na+-translocating ferredoxin:NAD+ oxidoreductase RnfD subunit
LLPVWRHPGANMPQRRRLQERLAWGGRWRAVLFLAGGVWLAFDDLRAWLPVAIGMLLFAVQLLRGWVDRLETSDDNSRLP